jgi:hypothetical protein
MQAWLEALDPAIVSVCETWLNPTICDSEIISDSYTVFRKDRAAGSGKSQRGGGVLLAVKPALNPTRMTHLENSAEIVWVSVKCGDYSLLIGSAYRAPNCDETMNNDLLLSIDKVQEIQHKYHGIFLCGDFNVDIDWNCGDYAKARNNLSDNFLSSFINVVPHQMVLEATRITATSRSVLDLVLTNSPSKIADLEVIPGISDHMAISFKLQWQPPKQKTVRRIMRNYCKADWDLLRDLFRKNMFIEDFSDVECAWSQWKKIFWECVDKAIPSVRVHSRRRAPWINGGIIRLVHKRNYLHKRWKNGHSDSAWEKYRQARNTAKVESRKAHEKFVWNLSCYGGDNGKKLWKYIHGMTGSSAPKHFVVDDVNESDSNKIAESFVQHFRGNFTTVMGDASVDCQQSQGNDAFNIMESINFSSFVVEKALMKTKAGSATGPDDIPARILHVCSKELAPSLAKLFETSMKLGTIPTQWKFANVVPIFKSGNRNIISNYRPISLTSVVGKVMERVVSWHLLRHLQDINVINSQQHGFLPRRSCVTMLTKAIDDWQHYLDGVSGSRVDVISLDWAKAFDRVQHNRLLSKLQSYHVSGELLQWLRSFLVGRKMSVVFDGAHSTEQSVMSGVPQGSVLGPLLFTTFMLDLPQHVKSTMCQYADDCTIYRNILSPEDTKVLQEDLCSIDEWCEINYLPLNLQKCKLISLTKSRRTLMDNMYQISGHVMDRCDSLRILGITVTSDLKWNVQTDIVRNKSARVLNFVGRILHGSKPSVKRSVYLGLVRPIITYGVPAWHPTTSTNIMKLEKVQRRATVFITGQYHSSKDRLKMTNLISIEHLLQEIDIVFFKKIILNMVDIGPLSRVSVNENNKSRTNLIGMVNPPFARTSMYQNGFYYRVAKLFNSLPTKIRLEQNFNFFQSSLRTSITAQN